MEAAVHQSNQERTGGFPAVASGVMSPKGNAAIGSMMLHKSNPLASPFRSTNLEMGASGTLPLGKRNSEFATYAMKTNTRELQGISGNAKVVELMEKAARNSKNAGFELSKYT